MRKTARRPMLTAGNGEESAFDRLMQERLDDVVGDIKRLPSEHIKAWRQHERATINALGRNPAPDGMAYNLYTDCVKHLRTARGLMDSVTDKDLRRLYGFPPRQVPRHALAVLAKSVGYRYLRGLESVAVRLPPHVSGVFTQERKHFLATFTAMVDAAHLLNDQGQCPQAVDRVIHAFQEELASLAVWLERVGDHHNASWFTSELG